MPQRNPRLIRSSSLLGAVLLVLGWTAHGPAYIDAPGFVTPPRMMEQFESVAVVTVEKLNANNSAVVYRVAEQLWGRAGKLPKGSILKHHSLPKELFARLKPGQVGVLLHDIEASRLAGDSLKVGDSHHLLFIEGGWYQAGRNSDDPQWWGCWTTRNYDVMFVGSTEELASVFRKLAQGEDVVVRRNTSAEEQKEGAAATELVRYSMKAPHQYRKRVEDAVKEPTIDKKLPAAETRALAHLDLQVNITHGNGAEEGDLRQALHAIAGVRYLICKASGVTRVYFQDAAPDVDELMRAATKAGFKARRPEGAK